MGSMNWSQSSGSSTNCGFAGSFSGGSGYPSGSKAPTSSLPASSLT